MKVSRRVDVKMYVVDSLVADIQLRGEVVVKFSKRPFSIVKVV